MKAIRILGLLVVLSMLLVAAPASAAGPAGSWATGIACQNMGTSAALISISFYSEGSATAALTYTDPNTVAVDGSRNYYTPNSFADLPASFLGSGVVSSDQPLACNINTQTTGTGTGASPYRIATAGAVSEEAGAPIAYVPQVMKTLGGTWNSYIAVQNTSMANVAVTVTYKDRNGVDQGSATEHATVPGQSNKVFYQADNAGLAAGFLGSAVVSADDGTTKLAVLVNLYNNAADSSNAQFLSYNGVSTGGQKLFVPRFVRNYYGYNGGLSIQNIGAADTTVTINFHFAGNTYTYTSPTIVKGAALALYAPQITELNPVDALGNGQRFGSAEITTTGTVVAIVNEDNRGVPLAGEDAIPAERKGQGGTYNAPVDGPQTTTVLFPQVTNKAGGVFSGGFQVANTTATLAHCNISFAGQPGASQTNVELPANGSLARFGPGVAGLAAGFNGAATVVCDQPVIGIGNLAVEVGSGKVGDSLTVTTGINK